MSPNTRLPLFVLPAALLLGVTGCTASAPAPTDGETYASAPATPEPATATPNPVESDAVLLLRTTATAANGARLALEVQVHQAYAWDYAGIGTLPAALIDDCGGSLTESQIEEGQYSFVRINISALPDVSGPAWPADARIDVRPSADYALTAGRGMLSSDPATGDSLCLQDKFFSGAGNGGMAIAIPGDAVALTGWAGHTYGVTARPGVTFSDCSIELTPLGTSLGAGTADWTSAIDDATCASGAVNEVTE